MQIGEVIRTHRKEKNMTQQEMAGRLGVTPPAVNKWENGNSMPDIMLLAPIARLLDITLDTLLSYHETLTDEETKTLIYELDDRLKSEPYDAVFAWVKELSETYPNCDVMLLRMAQILDAQRCIQELPDAESYEEPLIGWMVRALDSKEEEVRSSAAESLFGIYLRKEEYEKAEEYLSYFSRQNPERKRKQAVLYSKTNRIEDAYRSYEELLFSSCQSLNMVFQSMYVLAMQQENLDKARMLAKKQRQLAVVFEMGPYYEYSSGLDIAVADRDVDATIAIMEGMLGSVDQMGSFCQSPLYEHMTFRALSKDFLSGLKTGLIENFRDEETYGFLKSDPRWQELPGIGRDESGV